MVKKKTSYICEKCGSDFDNLETAEKHEEIPINTLPVGLFYFWGNPTVVISQREILPDHNVNYNTFELIPELTLEGGERGEVRSCDLKKWIQTYPPEPPKDENIRQLYDRKVVNALRSRGITELILDLEGTQKFSLPELTKTA
jgi:hypothetical protein